MTKSTESGTQTTAPVQAIRLIFRALAIVFAVVGITWLVFPNDTARTINAVGRIFRVSRPASESNLRFWVSLGVSYRVVTVLLAWLIQRDPPGFRYLMPVLAVTEFCSFFTRALFVALSSPTFLNLLSPLVDGSIVLLVYGCYWWLALEERTAAQHSLTGSDSLILNALIDGLFPPTAALPVGGCQTPLAPDLWEYCGELHRTAPALMVLLLRGLELGPYLWGPRRTRFTRLSAEERQRYLSGFERSRFTLRRQVIAGLKLIAMLHFYDYPEAQRGTGYDDNYLRRKLLAGPNAAHHAARLQ